MLQGKKILIGITGSIAAYKIPHLVRLLVKKGATVKVVMTRAAADFVSPLTLSTLTQSPVLIDLFDEQSWANHVMLGRWADVFLVAPLSCNTLSKMAHGACDNLLLATYLSATCPVVVAPAMDEDMWHHPTTKDNLNKLAAHGCRVLPVGYGELASGLVGEGRMAEPEVMADELEQFLRHQHELRGKKALVTAGPTYEALDPVRFIGNHSSGKMGYALAQELQQRGAEVVLVSGPVHQPRPVGVQVVPVVSAAQMWEACQAHPDFDLAVMAAAVADYAPLATAPEKLKKNEEVMTLSLAKTKDILGSLGSQKKPGQVLVGFALETENEEQNAVHKLHRKNADLIVLNSLRQPGAGFGYDTNQVALFYKSGERKAFPLLSKKETAKNIVDAIIPLLP